MGGKNKVVAGTAAAAVVYNGDALRAVADDPRLAFDVPREGSEIWMDSMAIPAKAPHPEAAHKFINYMLQAKVGAQLANYLQYGTPNEAAMEFITPEDRDNPAIYPPDAVMNTLEFTQDLGKDNRLMDEVWTLVKSR